jgi:hypothetical protein
MRGRRARCHCRSAVTWRKHRRARCAVGVAAGRRAAPGGRCARNSASRCGASAAMRVSHAPRVAPIGACVAMPIFTYLRHGKKMGAAGARDTDRAEQLQAPSSPVSGSGRVRRLDAAASMKNGRADLLQRASTGARIIRDLSGGASRLATTRAHCATPMKRRRPFLSGLQRLARAPHRARVGRIQARAGRTCVVRHPTSAAASGACRFAWRRPSAHQVRTREE